LKEIEGKIIKSNISKTDESSLKNVFESSNISYTHPFSEFLRFAIDNDCEIAYTELGFRMIPDPEKIKRDTVLMPEPKEKYPAKKRKRNKK